MSYPHKEIITVLAKTYPECSRKYGCLVCTAGINEDGEWRRIYPIPYMWFLDNAYKNLQFGKYDTIEVTLERAKGDYRGESFKVIHPEKIQVVGALGKEPEPWQERMRLLLKYVDSGLEGLSEAKKSLGLIKPERIVEFKEKERSRLGDKGEEDVLEKLHQSYLEEFAGYAPKLPPQPESLPWLGFHFTCRTADCQSHEMMCIDWEMQQLYRKVGFEKTKQKADWMNQRDIYFVVGTTWKFARWMIIGLVYPPRGLDTQSLESFLKPPEA